jgi:hypothetical protein
MSYLVWTIPAILWLVALAASLAWEKYLDRKDSRRAGSPDRFANDEPQPKPLT